MHAKTKETHILNKRTVNDCIAEPLLQLAKNSNTEAAKIIGNPERNEISIAHLRERPVNNPPKITLADLDIPGMNAKV